MRMVWCGLQLIRKNREEVHRSHELLDLCKSKIMKLHTKYDTFHHQAKSSGRECLLITTIYGNGDQNIKLKAGEK